MKQTYRRCNVCKLKFTIDPQRPFKVVCSPECAEDEKGIRAGEIRRKKLKNEERKAAYKIKQQEKKKLEKTFPSIGEVQALADKLGKHYGEVSQMLATGKLTL